MSLNKYEQTLFAYLEGHPEELRHWQARVAEAVRSGREPGQVARELERDLWSYLAERSEHVPSLRELHRGELRRVSLQNMSEYLLRIFGPPVSPRRSGPG